MTLKADVEALFRDLLDRCNNGDAAGYGALFTDDGGLVGFDASCVETAAAIVDHLAAIFGDHQTATYVAIVREIRRLGPTTALLRTVERRAR